MVLGNEREAKYMSGSDVVAIIVRYGPSIPLLGHFDPMNEHLERRNIFAMGSNSLD